MGSNEYLTEAKKLLRKHARKMATEIGELHTARVETVKNPEIRAAASDFSVFLISLKLTGKLTKDNGISIDEMYGFNILLQRFLARVEDEIEDKTCKAIGQDVPYLLSGHRVGNRKLRVFPQLRKNWTPLKQDPVEMVLAFHVTLTSC